MILDVSSRIGYYDCANQMRRSVSRMMSDNSSVPFATRFSTLRRVVVGVKFQVDVNDLTFPVVVYSL